MRILAMEHSISGEQLPGTPVGSTARVYTMTACGGSQILLCLEYGRVYDLRKSAVCMVDGGGFHRLREAWCRYMPQFCEYARKNHPSGIPWLVTKAIWDAREVEEAPTWFQNFQKHGVLV